MTQSKADSFMEAACSTTIGFFVSLVTWAVTAPLLGIPLIWTQSFIITGIFTAVSVLRSYIIRRMFNGRSIWKAIRMRLCKEPHVYDEDFHRSYQSLCDKCGHALICNATYSP